MFIFYDFFQCAALFHHWSFTASPDDWVGQSSEKGWDGEPLKWSGDWVSEELSFRDESKIKWCEDTNESPGGGGEGNSMESKWWYF